MTLRQRDILWGFLYAARFDFGRERPELSSADYTAIQAAEARRRGRRGSIAQDIDALKTAGLVEVRDRRFAITDAGVKALTTGAR